MAVWSECSNFTTPSLADLYGNGQTEVIEGGDSTAGQADCADFAVRRGVAIDRIFSDTWHLDEADAAYRKADAQVAGKGVFLF